MPEGLVGDEGRAHGRNQAEGGEGWHCSRDGEQPKQQDRRDRSTPPQTSANPQPQGDVREQVQGDPAAKAERRDGPERIVHIGERRLQPER